jgi:hypothetical protein
VDTRSLERKNFGRSGGYLPVELAGTGCPSWSTVYARMLRLRSSGTAR